VIGKKEQGEFYKQVGGLIKQARLKRDLKQEFIANKLGLTRTSIVNIEQGEQRIQLHAILELAKMFEMDVTEFFPEISVYANTSLNKNSETIISKAIDQQVNDTENVSEILRTFIKYTQKK